MSQPATRIRLMDAAQELILDYGYSGTSLDRVIEKAGVTKGAFFYHFKSKAELARALVQRFADDDRALLEQNLAEAESRFDDPLDQVLDFIRLFENTMDELVEPYPGCLFASYVMEAGLFDDDTLKIARGALERWRRMLGRKFREVAERHPPRREIDPDSLADGISVIFEGSFILSKTYRDPGLVAEHLRHYRRYVELLFGRA